MREGARAILEQIGLTIANRRQSLQPFQLAEYRAAKNWLRRYRQRPEATNIDKVKGYLEAFFHLCNVTDWESACQVATTGVEGNEGEELHRLLFVWGYYLEQKQLYRALLHRVSPEMDLICLNGLGSLHDVLGDYARAIACQQQMLALAQSLGQVAAQGTALGGLGSAYLSLGEYDRAIAHYQQHLEMARETGALASVGVALGNLGNAYRIVEAYDLAQDCLKERLGVARSLSDLKGEGDGLCNLGSLYSVLGKRAMAKRVLRRAVEIAKAEGHRLGLVRALGNLGLVQVEIGAQVQAVECFEQALVVAREIGDREGERLAVVQLGALCQKLSEYERAFRYQQAALGFVVDGVERAALLLNLGTACREMGRWESAVGFYQALQTTAVLMEEDVPEKRLLEMMAFYCLALVYRELGKVSLAFRCCRAALDLSHESVAPLIDKCLALQSELGLLLLASEQSRDE